MFSFVVREWADLWEISCVVNADHRDVEIILIIVSCYVPFLLSVMFAVWSVVRWINWKRQSTEEQSNKQSVAKAEINNCEVPITGDVILLMIANLVLRNRLLGTGTSFLPHISSKVQSDVKGKYLIFEDAVYFQWSSFQWDEGAEVWYLVFHFLLALRCLVNPIAFAWIHRGICKDLARKIMNCWVEMNRIGRPTADCVVVRRHVQHVQQVHDCTRHCDTYNDRSANKKRLIESLVAVQPVTGDIRHQIIPLIEVVLRAGNNY